MFQVIEIQQTKFSVLPVSELIELLEYKLQCLEKADDEDSSWNYGIDELKKQIKELKKL